jgi:hypothetical protein
MHLMRHTAAARSPAAASAVARCRAAPRGVASVVAPRNRTTTTLRALPQSQSAPAPQPPVPGLAAQPWLGTPEQDAALEELRARFSSASASSPAQPPADELLRWYLRDRYFSVDDAERKLRSMLEWRARYATPGDGGSAGALWQPLGLPGVAEGDVGTELATGKAYVHDGPDAAGRPVLVVVARKHTVGEFVGQLGAPGFIKLRPAAARTPPSHPPKKIKPKPKKKGEYPLEDSKRMCMHLLDEVVSRLPPTAEARSPGEEQLLGIFDLKGFELKNADLAFVAFLIEAFFEYYPRRVGQVLLVDAPWIFQAPWKAIKPLLRKYSALVRFVDRETLLGEYFNGGPKANGNGAAAPLAPPRDFV